MKFALSSTTRPQASEESGFSPLVGSIDWLLNLHPTAMTLPKILKQQAQLGVGDKSATVLTETIDIQEVLTCVDHANMNLVII